MATVQTAVAFLRQLRTTLDLIAAPSSSLTIDEIVEIRKALIYASNSLGAVIEERNLEIDGVTLSCESTPIFSTPYLLSKTPTPTTVRPWGHWPRAVLGAVMTTRPEGPRPNIVLVGMGPLALLHRTKHPFRPQIPPRRKFTPVGLFPVQTYPFLIRHLEA